MVYHRICRAWCNGLNAFDFTYCCICTRALGVLAAETGTTGKFVADNELAMLDLIFAKRQITTAQKECHKDHIGPYKPIYKRSNLHELR